MVKPSADFSVKSAQAPGPYRQALIKTISRGFDRVVCIINYSYNLCPILVSGLMLPEELQAWVTIFKKYMYLGSLL